MPSAAAPRMILSSMSVRFMTQVTAQAAGSAGSAPAGRRTGTSGSCRCGRGRRPSGRSCRRRRGRARSGRAAGPRRVSVSWRRMVMRAPRTVATARAEIVRPAPSSPARLPVDALTLTAAVVERRARRRSPPRIASRRAPEPRARADDRDVDRRRREGRRGQPRDDVAQQQRRCRCARGVRCVGWGTGGRGRPVPAAPSSASATACSTTSPSEWPASAGAPAIAMPPRRSGEPGPNGWLSWPNPTRGAPAREQLLDPARGRRAASP